MKKLVFAALLLAACSDPLGFGGVQVRPEQELYAVFGSDQPVTVRYTVTNTDDSPVGVLDCGVRIQKKANGVWNTLTPPGIACLPSPPRTIDPGGSVMDSVTVQGPGTWRVLVPWTRTLGRSGTAESTEFTTRIPPD